MKRERLVRLQTFKCPFILALCALFLLTLFGCAKQPPRLSAELRNQLGRVGVLSAQYTPAVEFALPAKGWLEGAARGAGGGTKAFIILVPVGSVGVAGGLIAFRPDYLLISAAALVGGAGYLIIGPFYGATTAATPETVKEAEAQLKKALVSMRIQETMRTYMVQEAAQSPPRVILTVLETQGPETPSDLLTYFPLQNPNIDTVLELRVNRLWLKPNPSFLHADLLKPSQVLQINPSLSLGMEVRGRLIRIADKVVLYDNTWKRESEAHLFSEWAANEAKLFAEEFDRHYKYFAGKVVHQIF